MIKLNAQKLKSLTLSQKKSLYKKAKSAYYNDQPLMSDESFDLLEDDLKELAPNWVGLKDTGAPVAKNIKKKVKLPIPMFSLDKVKPGSVDAWLAKQTSSTYVVSLKADGASLEIILKGGKPVQAITRGDGRIGGDVSYLIPHMRIPQKVGSVDAILRCEAIFTAKAFSKYREVFDAARNAASGVLNRQDVHEAVKDLSIVVLQVLQPNVRLSKGLAWAKAKGFAVIPHKVVNKSSLSSQALVRALEAQRAKAKFQIDGLVVARDEVNPLPKAGNPDWAIAFKMPLTAVPTVVKAVHWDVSHLGALIPRIEYRPVEWEGSTLSFATAFSAKYVEENRINKGTKVEIVRSGDIIPYVTKVWVNKTQKPALPPVSQFGAWHWDANHTHILLDEPKDNDTFRVKRLARFFVEMEADFVREKTVRKMYDQGLTNLRKILKAPPEAFAGPGVTLQGAQRLYEAIHKVVDVKTPLTRLMVASTTFPRGMGQKRFQSLGEVVDLLKLPQMPREKQIEIITSTPGWNTKTAEIFLAGLPKFIKWLDIVGLPYVNDTGKAKVKKVIEGPMTGVGVTWTGYRDKQEEQRVVDAGGQVVPFGSKTQILLTREGGKSSSKLQKAQDKGIKVWSWKQLEKRYGL